ncbi:MAG TPA: crosslink repair DNA glycosylase YcaQ family protein [Streptosporangiaceae bacterium]
MSIDVTRAQVMAYRMAATGLDRALPPGAPVSGLPVLDLGVQDTPYGTARIALAARLPAPPPADVDGLTLVWAARGAPHLHRRGDLPAVARALWPLSDADATARIMNPRMKEGARLGRAAFTAAAEALRAAVPGPTPKGEASTRVSARVPASLTYDCVPCKARHISGALFQQIGVAAAVRVVPEGRSTVLAPVGGDPWPVPESAAGTDDLVRAYLRLLGPAGPAEAAAFLGTNRANAAPVWPGGLAEVRVDGRTAWLPEECVDALRAAAPPEYVRLVPARDPLLQARDRDVLLPRRGHQKMLWTAISAPGAVLANGEIAGVWRARAAGKSAIEVAVTPFAPLPRAVVAAVEAEAQVLAALRAVPSASVTIAEPA